MSNGWLILVFAGLFEVGFTTLLKLSQSFTRVGYSVGFAICAVLSFLLLNWSLKSIPLGTAYAVWTGIGAIGTALIGIALFAEPCTWPRLLFLGILIGSIIGLKLFAPAS